MVFLQCASLWEVKWFFEKMPWCKNCIWMVFLQCDSLHGKSIHVYKKCLIKKLKFKCFFLQQCESLYEKSNKLLEKMPYHKKYIWMAFTSVTLYMGSQNMFVIKCRNTKITYEWVLFSVGLYGKSNDFFEKMPYHKNYIWMAFFQCDSLYGKSKHVC